MAVAPHSLASQSALAVLHEGGNAIEAMIAAAATIAVVYPHMNSIGGDSFWLLHVPGEAPGAIDAAIGLDKHARLRSSILGEDAFFGEVSRFVKSDVLLRLKVSTD